MPVATPCPDLRSYQSLSSGQMADADKEALLQHLEGCDFCVRKLQSLSGDDSLIQWIKQTRTLAAAPADQQLAALMQRIIKLVQPPAASKVAHPPGTLTFSCGSCRKSLRVKQEAAGKKVKCPHCGQVVPVPAATPAVRSEAIETAILPPASTSETAATVANLSPSSKERELCAFLSPSQAPDEIGRLGSYRVLKVLGAGGMGVVFRAEDPQLQRLVALKAMLPALAVNESARQRFLREARAAASLKHDHIVTIHQVGEDGGAPFLAMEFLEGEALEDRLKREGKLPLAETLRIGREIAEGLQAAHEHGLIHRDIKPANVWLEGKRGRVKILDFGLARSSSEDIQLTQSGAIVGTPAYMPPEQARGESVDARCDLYSLGCVLYRLCTGELPFKADNTMSLLLALATEQPKSPREINADVPLPLADLILRLLAKEPAQRPATAGDVAQALQDIAVEKSPTPVAATAPAPLRRRRILLWGAAAGAFLATALLIVIVIRQSGSEQGTVTIETVDPDVELVFTGGGRNYTIRNKKTGDEIELPLGSYRVELQGDKKRLMLKTNQFTLKRGERIWVRVTRQTGVAAPAPRQERPATGRFPLLDPAWLKQVATLPPKKQIEAVVAKLKEGNPGFNGKVDYKIEKWEVTELHLSGQALVDISAVRALPKLRALQVSDAPLSDLSPLKGMALMELHCDLTRVSDLSPLRDMPLEQLSCNAAPVLDLSPLKGMKLRLLGVGKTNVSDLAPLRGMKLTTLACDRTRVSDLSPLRGMPLEYLNCIATPVSDLAPLRGMKLTTLACDETPVSDLTPLKEMKLTSLQCGGTKVSDLSPLRGMPLEYLYCQAAPVSDLSPLEGLPLWHLACGNTKVSDLSPLKDMKLTSLDIRGTKVSSLSLLKSMPLKVLWCDFRPERDAAILRSIKTLEKINDKPAAKLWKEVNIKSANENP